ncbi:FAD-dependent monooxygenase [Halobacillus hunanensis]|uniref:FAD-dependent monooxygenase n=1 Tax=Halobacillus hunanensis TaxID=578214 RepID=UPI0009A787F3|nr:FAD-dependent monooxygenase [Halobacillus hunanensis]
MIETTKIPFTVIGGGIGGLAAALGAAESGRQVYVLEQAPEFGEIGAGIQLGPNAMAVLDRFGLLGEIDKYAVYPKRLVLKDALTGEELTDLDLGDSIKEQYGYTYTVMHRSDLHKVLLEACEKNPSITLLTNQQVSKVENHDDFVTIECTSGEVYEAESLVGADGIWSKTRELFSQDEGVTEGYVAYRGAIPMHEISEHADFDDVIMWIAPNLHLVQYPVRRKELYNQVAVFKSFNYKKGKSDWGTPEELDEHFGKCCPKVQKAVTFMSRERRWEMYDKEPINNWTENRLTLLGDSAHPMYQYLAQGACQALEDASYLTDKLNEYGDEDINKAFNAYQEERMPRTAQVQKRARVWGDIIHADDPVARLMRDSYFKTRQSTSFEDVEWMYGYFKKSSLSYS